MITRSHIISFSVLVILYMTVGIWKYWTPEKLNNQTNDREENIDQIVAKEFWDHYQKATASRTAGNYGEAIDHYNEVLERDPEHKDALYYLGSMHLFQRQFTEAEKYWLQLEDIQENTPRTQLQLGTLYFCMDEANPLFEMKKAKNKFSYAKDLNREEIGAPLQLSKIAIMNNNMTEAAELLDAVLAADGNNYQALFLRGYIDWREGNLEKGKEQLMKSWRIFQSLGHTEIQGEGATKKGAKAMVSEDMFCDLFRKNIDSLLQQSMRQLDFKSFDKQLSDFKTDVE